MPTIACQISAENQDCLLWKDILGNWQFTLSNDEIKIGWGHIGSKAQGSGLYFSNIPIPPGSTIYRATLIVRSSRDRWLYDVRSIIELEDNPNPLPFSTAADFWARSFLDDTVVWRFPRYTTWKKDELYGSPDISNLVQQIIDLPGWAEGNPIVISWNDFHNASDHSSSAERMAYAFDKKPEETARLEITYAPPTPLPPPQPPLPPPPPPERKGWAGLDLQYEYLDDGFKLTFHTDVPCHLFCRMTTTPPRRHSLPSMRRGLRISGDIRFCFVVYEDNEQQEPGDTLIHTFVKDAWPVCERRWFYFIGRVYGDTSPSESPIFEFHFPAPPPEPPPPIEKIFIASHNNRTLWYSHGNWAIAHNTGWGNIHPGYDPPTSYLFTGDSLTASYWFWRCVLDFNTATLPDTAKIQSAQIALYVTHGGTDNPARPRLYATPGVQQLPPVNSDYGAQNSITDILGQFDLTTLILNAYNDIPLNAAGLASINPLAKTLFCLRGQIDVEFYISVPRYASSIRFYSQQKGAGFYPLLKVQYYPA